MNPTTYTSIEARLRSVILMLVDRVKELENKLRIAEAVTENSKRAHEILCGSPPGQKQDDQLEQIR